MLKSTILILTVCLIQALPVWSQIVQSNTSYSDLTVMTLNGYVRGVTYTNGLRRVMNSWRSVPFAQPPVGTLRFKPPQAVQSWTGVKDTIANPLGCQSGGMGPPGMGSSSSEDCLYLNIFAPHPMGNNLPVMVWIHGGAFVSGSAASYDPTMIVTEQNVVVAVIQYRLGILGFMYLNDSSAPGNMGMLDQVMALKWIKDNIASFGGDPNRITLFGQSAGGASVSHHLLSPLSRSLFNNAIIESGSSLMPDVIANSDAAVTGYKAMLNRMGCTQTNLNDAVACAQRVNVSTVLSSVTAYDPSFQARPLVDGYFMPQHPATLLAAGNFKTCPILIGSTKDEANFLLLMSNPPVFNGFNTLPSLNQSSFQQSIANQIPNYPNYPTRITQNTLTAIISEYTNWGNSNNGLNNFYSLDYAVSDYTFRCPIVDLANSYARFNNYVFMYYFTHHSSQSPFPDWFGAIHGDEIAFVYGAPLIYGSNYTSEEKMLSTKMMTYWTNFARYGTPNGPSSSSTVCNTFKFICSVVNFLGNLFNKDQLPTWPVYQFTNSDNQREYLILQTGSFKTDYNFLANRCALWNYQLPLMNSLTRPILYQ